MSQYIAKNSQVVFKRREGLPQWRYEMGHVVWRDDKRCSVCFLAGFRSYTDTVPFEDVVAVYDESQPLAHIGPFKGRSRMLQPVEAEPE